MDGKDPICYWRGKATDFADPNPSFRWLPLINDLSLGAVDNSWEAGMISLKLSLNNVSASGKQDFKKQPTFSKAPPKRLNANKIRIFIF